MSDPTEYTRRAMCCVINTLPAERDELAARYGQVWDTEELCRDFDVEGFMAPFVVATRKSDGIRGTLTFQHSPRFYFDWKAA